MKRTFYIFLILIFLPVVLFSQDKKEVKKAAMVNEPAQSLYTDIFSINKDSFTFNKLQDYNGKGEILEVHFEVFNNTDLPRNLYIYIIGTYEKVEWIMNSFDTKKIMPKGTFINYFKSYPEDLANFEYEIDNKKTYIKVPKDPKKGVDPNTGKAYRLDGRLFVRARLLCNYRKKYKFFNHVTIMVYDDEGKSIFRQVYNIDGSRR